MNPWQILENLKRLLDPKGNQIPPRDIVTMDEWEFSRVINDFKTIFIPGKFQQLNLPQKIEALWLVMSFSLTARHWKIRNEQLNVLDEMVYQMLGDVIHYFNSTTDGD